MKEAFRATGADLPPACTGGISPRGNIKSRAIRITCCTKIAHASRGMHNFETSDGQGSPFPAAPTVAQKLLVNRGTTATGEIPQEI